LSRLLRLILTHANAGDVNPANVDENVSGNHVDAGVNANHPEHHFHDGHDGHHHGGANAHGSCFREGVCADVVHA
jgi:hypothetical protein